MLFQEFLKVYRVGETYGYKGTYKGECVSLVKCYIRDVLDVDPQSIGNAKEYWLKKDSKYIRSVFEPIKNTPDFIPKRGDVFVRSSGKYGHIGIVISATKKEFYTIEQNFQGCRKVKRITHTTWTDINFLRPKNQKNIVEVPTIKPGIYKLTNVRGVYNGYGADSGRKKVHQLTADGKKHATKKIGNAYLKAETEVSINDIRRLSSGNLWAKIPSGYICIWEWKINKKFVK